MASALRAWGEFCESLCISHSPVDPVRASQFAAICREPGTYGQYISHLKSACEVLGWPSRWSNDPRVVRAKEGLKKASLVYKGPRLSVGIDLVCRLGTDMARCTPDKFFCLFSWVFLLRARSEASSIVRAASVSMVTDRFKPLEAPGAVCLISDELVLRLRSRKNRIGGDSVSRGCSCNRAVGTVAHAPSGLCPVHVLWPWIVCHAGPGDPLFPPRIADSAGEWLKVALKARDVPNADRFTLHSLRRGAAQALVEKGGDLATLMLAGGWRSSAFRAYLDLMGIEKSIFSGAVDVLVDLDDDDSV